MANHKSSIKRIRQTETKNLQNRYFAKTARNAVRNLRAEKDKDAAVKLYPSVSSMLDKLAKKNLIHKNKAANLKSSLSKMINKMA
ncbi:MAG TPA: 30S ribosomal protein S20 [Paludibacteraceae bacterium]|jgi:small subunit ribosomal protein S20|nr:30S ribosomal protein S20 [Paludibacteraceae bacterium]HOU69107.1 30S ribosomal protein S20 [Paludibacteraceae bacterium]HPH63417.1 30S ribosomal protein S20 [Paludibacteraceae bacterium]HQF50907.1 30S ribosomal protein S20 [Paludibacteraceae bacterium]HQJ89212.1 30S ribosomal protein S20 [Paludibacteraceae bacterium]